MTAAAKPARLGAVAGLAGLWRRTLLVDVDGSRDASPGVCWLQGPSLFVDLRMPGENRPLEGFAGRFACEGEVFEWQRTIDLDPHRAVPDAATLHTDAGVLVETGVHAPYVEHWVPDPAGDVTGWGAELVAADGSRAVVVRAGSHFGWAMRTPTSTSISLGVVESGRWVIGSSSDPSCAGHDLALRVRGTLAGTAHPSQSDEIETRTWTLTRTEGDDL